MGKMRLVLMGTNGWTVPIFDRIADEHEVLAVFTRAPKPAGRRMELKKSPVHAWADQRGLTVRHDVRNYDLRPDCVVVISYGVILRENVLNSAPVINVHPSLLPKYRGPSPMLTALANGDPETGVCITDVTDEIDAGAVHMVQKIEIGENDSNDDLEKKVSAVSAEMLSAYLRNPDAYPGRPQRGLPSFSRKFIMADTIIDWGKPPREIHNQIRSIGGRATINGMDVKILQTRLADDGGLEIVRVQPAGKKPMDWQSFVNGRRGGVEIGK
jgi:methionyl-tRNA formyltransferase